MSADVAVLRLRGRRLGWFELEDLKIGALLATEESEFAHDRSWIDIQVLQHPIAVVVFERPEGVDQFAADHVDEEALGLIKVGDGEANVLGAA
ncbi:hypothetical protein GALL_470270 [mine drainage metagenome]|uniref:Uncharacterized protein n=1 Tax=mine drainage metagenome TaxID=410659 RepID=A0A1J5PUE3_9ZZZZ